MIADLAEVHQGMYALVWPTVHGTACLMISVSEKLGAPRDVLVYPLTPMSRPDRLRRAGPDVVHLAGRHIIIFGCGAIGSRVALLGRSGATDLAVVDGDTKLPVNVVRHTSMASGCSKWSRRVTPSPISTG